MPKIESLSAEFMRVVLWLHRALGCTKRVGLVGLVGPVRQVTHKHARLGPLVGKENVERKCDRFWAQGRQIVSYLGKWPN